jgi:hypothetical protein
MMPILDEKCELALILLAKCQFIAIKYDERHILYDLGLKKFVYQQLGVNIASIGLNRLIGFLRKEKIMIFSAIARQINSQLAAKMRAGCALVLLLILASCAASGAKEAEIAAEQAAIVAVEQEAARIAAEREEMEAAEMQRKREAQEAERRRLEAVAQLREEREAARIEQARLAQEQAERVAMERQAAVEAQRQAKQQRIAELELLLAEVESATRADESATVIINEAVGVSEDLLDALSAELAKYEETDSSGNTIVPLAKERINELETRKNELMRQIGSQ